MSGLPNLEVNTLIGDQSPPTVEQADDENDDDVLWPLPYQMQASQAKWWSHSLYRGPKKVSIQVFYSKDKAQSEVLAQKFLDEPVIGFDMEWPWDSQKRSRLQEKIGLIQVASEDKIALFHIGLHSGETSEEIIAPSLRKLIESPTIAKTGVNILYADFARLKKYFDLKPQGAFELSHLHSLVKFGSKPDLLTTKLTKLAYQVEEHLGLPLSKGSVRTSNWSRPLNQEQINYAADDAYAGFMLFHCMNAKRAALKPVPPLPIFAENYPSKMSTGSMEPTTALRLHPLEDGGDDIMACDFFKSTEEEEEEDAADKEDGKEDEKAEIPASKTKGKRKTQATKSKGSEEPLDLFSKSLYDVLAIRRKALAAEQSVPAYRIATNAVLEGLARRQPEEYEHLLEVKGIGKLQQEKYGAEWLEVIAQYLATNEKPPITEGIQEASFSPSDTQPIPATPTHTPRRRRILSQDSSDSSTAFVTPVQHTPQLHTGLSFSLAETQLTPEDAAAEAPPSPNLPLAGQLRRQDVPFHRLVDAIYPILDEQLRGQSNDMDSDSLKRKRPELSLSTQNPAPLAELPEPLTPRSKIFRNQLVAFSKQVARKLPARPPSAGPVVSDATLDRIVALPPRTMEDLARIQGIESFMQACKEANVNLLRNIIKFAPVRF